MNGKRRPTFDAIDGTRRKRPRISRETSNGGSTCTGVFGRKRGGEAFPLNALNCENSFVSRREEQTALTRSTEMINDKRRSRSDPPRSGQRRMNGIEEINLERERNETGCNYEGSQLSADLRGQGWKTF